MLARALFFTLKKYSVSLYRNTPHPLKEAVTANLRLYLEAAKTLFFRREDCDWLIFIKFPLRARRVGD